MRKRLDVYCLETTNYINIKSLLLFRYTHLPLHTQYATAERDGERYMTHKDFVCRYLQLTDPSCNQDTIRLLADVADTAKNKLISFAEFRSFEGLLCTPDAVNRLAFQLFDVEKKGTISFESPH